jgi:phage regulator Rha-like protein
MSIGIFHLKNLKCTQLLKKKYLDVAKAMINKLGWKVMQFTISMIERCQNVQQKLTDIPHLLEELVEKREYLAQIPKELNNLQPDMDATKLAYDALE